MQLLRILRTAAFFLTLTVLLRSVECAPYYGTKIGSLRTHAHEVVGDVYAVDDRTLYLKGFSYDGQGPDAYFWAGTTSKPDASGFIIPDEKGRKVPLKEYRQKDLLLRLPVGKTLRNIKWMAVWCRKFQANFGDVLVPAGLTVPQPAEIGRLPTKDHGVSSGPVMVVDTQTLLVPEFTYDGLGPAAYWWVSRGSRQHPRGLRLADENGSFSPLPKYTGRTVVITLPEEYTVYDFDWFGVWCEEARVDFGSVALPQDIVVPPSPRTLGIELEYKLNCEVLEDGLGYEVRWIMDGEDIVMQLVAKLEAGEYMAFGLSKNDSKSVMSQADAIVAYTDKRKKGHAVDYYLGSLEQCTGLRGSCPDSKFSDGQDSVTLLNAAVVNGYTMVTVKRPQVGLDEKYDQHVYSDGPQAVVWAVGRLNDKNEVSYHGALKNEDDIYIDFARPPQWNCPQPADPEQDVPPPPTTTTTRRPTTTTTTRKPTKRPPAADRNRKPKPTSEPTFRRKPQPIGPRYASRAVDVGPSASNVNQAWNVPPILCPADGTIRAQIGPTGGEKGYQSITGIVGWGIAWYMNGVLIPEITLERGKTYTFVVEGGNDPENSARSHPFYITDDPEGGYDHKTPAEKKRVKIYAGVTKDRRGSPSPDGMGRLCEWKLPKEMSSEDFETFEDFQESLELKCERGKPGKVTFTPDKDTPDLLYYQCYTHRYLGWKIHVVDSCGDQLTSLRHEASIQHLKNVTYNTFESDYKRGGEKKKLTSSAAASLEEDIAQKYNSDPKYGPGGNDGIPLVLPEVEEKKKEEAPPKNLYHKSSSSVYFKSPQYNFSTSIPASDDDLYYKPRQTTQENKKYFQTTAKPDSLYYKPANSASWKSSSTVKFNAPTMEPFRIRDVIPQGKPRTNNYYQVKPATVKPQYLVLNNNNNNNNNQGQTAPLKLRLYVSTQRPQTTRGPFSGTTRSQGQWWNHPEPQSHGRDRAINTLRNQLSAVQSSQHQGQRPDRNQYRSPSNVHYEKSFIPVVIKNNGSFETIVARHPSHQYGSPPGHSLALSATTHNGKSIVPVLVRAKEPVRRYQGETKNSNGIQTPLGRLPYPNSRKKASGDRAGQASGESFLPLLLPHGNSSTKVSSKKKVAPLIPLVVPEKKDDNLYILHQMLSLLNENPQSVATRGIKIVGNDRDRNVRPRVSRSADHHPGHASHDHEGHDDHDHHDHDHEKHAMDHTDPPPKSGARGLTFLFLSSHWLLAGASLFSVLMTGHRFGRLV